MPSYFLAASVLRVMQARATGTYAQVQKHTNTLSHDITQFISLVSLDLICLDIATDTFQDTGQHQQLRLLSALFTVSSTQTMSTFMSQRR